MADIVLRITGMNLDPDDCASRFPTDLVQNTWRIGDKSGPPVRPIATTNGLTLLLADEDDNNEAMARAYNALKAHASTIAELLNNEASAEMDIGLFVMSGQMQSLSFSVEFVDLLHDTRVELAVRAYPIT